MTGKVMALAGCGAMFGLGRGSADGAPGGGPLASLGQGAGGTGATGLTLVAGEGGA